MENQYGLYLSWEGTIVRLPVNPESYKITKDNDNGTYNVLGVGPIMVPRTPKLQVVSWSGLFPGRADLGAVLTAGGFQPPRFYIGFIQKIMDSRAAVRFVANRYLEDGSPIFDSNMEVLVTSFSTEERGGETGDFYYDIQLTEYRDYSPKTVILQQPSRRPASAGQQPAHQGHSPGQTGGGPGCHRQRRLLLLQPRGGAPRHLLWVPGENLPHHHHRLSASLSLPHHRP